jgi:hypothetical protein
MRKKPLLRALQRTRNPNKDIKYKVISEMRKLIKCELDGCDNPLTHYQGPGSQSLCREHQLRLRDYGGPARRDRPWTFWKKDHCEDCGHTPHKDNNKIRELKEPTSKILGMMMLHVDHIKAGGKDKRNKEAKGVNHPKNLVTLCQECHMLKTYLSGDHIKK